MIFFLYDFISNRQKAKTSRDDSVMSVCLFKVLCKLHAYQAYFKFLFSRPTPPQINNYIFQKRGTFYFINSKLNLGLIYPTVF